MLSAAIGGGWPAAEKMSTVWGGCSHRNTGGRYKTDRRRPAEDRSTAASRPPGPLTTAPTSGLPVAMDEVDLVNRDPNNINDHVKIHFEDVFAEPDSIHSFDCVWTASFVCFNCCKNFVYKFYTTVFGICIAMEWGAEFGWLAVEHVWFITPQLKFLELNCAVIKKVYGLCIHCCLDPCCEACGLLFGAFRK